MQALTVLGLTFRKLPVPQAHSHIGSAQRLGPG